MGLARLGLATRTPGAYANDLSDPRHLAAVTKRSNRQDSDRDPTQWMPNEAVHCHYTADWVTAKLR